MQSLTAPNSLAIGGIRIFGTEVSGNLISGCGKRYAIYQHKSILRFKVDILEGTVTEVLWQFRHSTDPTNNIDMRTVDPELTLHFRNNVGLHLFHSILT